MNDPCAPGYDPKTGLYHLSFQWNPHGPDWADISWGSATSPDLISWTLQDDPCLKPQAWYDRKGIFSGCMINGRDGSLTYAYTSVNHLPIHHSLQHVRGSESLSLAKSFDGGKTFERIAANPILPGEPVDLDVTGWRDPFVSKWPRMARRLGVDEDDTLFGIVSGGIRDVTPTTFLYSIDANDLSKWQYIGPLSNFGLNLRPSRWSGDLGKNWEVTNFTTLRDEQDPSVERDFVVMGTEGCITERRPSAPGPESMGPSRPARCQLWYSGKLREPSPATTHYGPVQMTFEFGGHLDHGCLYAANSFFDPKSNKQIVWGWITEEDICDDLRHEQGWSGVLAMPRELSIQTHHNVIGTCASDIPSITSIEKSLDSNGTYTIRTLASQPYQPLIAALRQNPSVRRTTLGKTELGTGLLTPFISSQNIQTSHWELDATFTVSQRTQNIGISIDHSGDFSRSTTIFFDPKTETFTLNRPAFPVLNSSELTNSEPECAPHTLFRFKDSETGKEEMEELHVRVWRDNSVLEVFVNGRTAISTRIYAAEQTFGMKFFADNALDGIVDVPSELVEATLWDGIGL